MIKYVGIDFVLIFKTLIYYCYTPSKYYNDKIYYIIIICMYLLPGIWYLRVSNV